MRIFTRYILRETLGYALLGGVLFTFILFMRYLLPLLELAVRGVASPTDLLRLVGDLLPSFITLTLPMAVLVGVLLGLSRLAADSEITAMRASGMGIISFLRIASLLAGVAWALGLVNTLWVAPRAAAAVLRFEAANRNGGVSLTVEPRVFYEDLKNYVLYVSDVTPGMNGSALWRHIFLADLTQPASPHIITAEEGAVAAGGGATPSALRMALADGTRHDTTAADPNQYNISTFTSTVVPVETGQQDEEDTHLSRRDTPMQAMPTGELWQRARRPTPAPGLLPNLAPNPPAGPHHTTPKSETEAARRAFAIELHRRFAYPTACLVLILVGVPLGLQSRRGGKGSGFAVTLLLVFLYYFLSSVGIALARGGSLPAWAGVWAANVIFATAGILLIQQIARGGLALRWLSDGSVAVAKLFRRRTQTTDDPTSTGTGRGSHPGMQRLRRTLRSRFPLILDEYVMGSFLRNFGLILLSFTALFLIFTFFELIGDIVRYRTPLVTVGAYLLNLIPFALYNLTPLCSLLAVLSTFGALNRSSELTAMKATGVSLYRIVAPVLLVAALLSVALFAFDELYLPTANRRQEALLSSIKGKPAQTFLRPDRKWMSGQTGPNAAGEPQRIFYYQAFDPDRDAFANLTVFEFQPGSFALTRRLFAANVHWDDTVHRWIFENGWERIFRGETVASFHPFTVESFPEIREQPAYFKKEERPSQEMSYGELGRYIRDLSQSGFNTTRLRVQLGRKLAYPLLTLVMAILAVPFSLVAGKRGSLAGIGAAVALAIGYWVVAGIFENLGDVNSLPAVLAAWSPDVLFATAGAYLLLRTPT